MHRVPGNETIMLSLSTSTRGLIFCAAIARQYSRSFGLTGPVAQGLCAVYDATGREGSTEISPGVSPQGILGRLPPSQRLSGRQARSRTQMAARARESFCVSHAGY